MKKPIALVFCGAFLVGFATPPLYSQVDDHNPVGVTGIFNGNIQTGCSYDPLTHSAHRAIDDIVVPGTVGKYPLKMTRYYNSRRFRSHGLGPAWTHEYWWSWDFNNGKVEYPNGNVWENHCATPIGVSDWSQDARTFRLADGGTVLFNDFGQPIQIVDPYGLITTIVYTNSLPTTVTEPGGRYLLFTYYTGAKAGLVQKVEAFDGLNHLIERVSYNFDPIPGGGTGPSQYCLTSVTYGDGTLATYAYEADNALDDIQHGSFKFWPVLSTANDMRYHGPMRRVAFDYQNNGPHGAITAERYSPSDGVKGLVVSSIDPPLPPPRSGGQGFQMPTDFTETRGDGSLTRTFHYTDQNVQRHDEIQCPDILGGPPTQMLLSYTDFQSHTTRLDYDQGVNSDKWYVKTVTDANTHTTNYVRGNQPSQGGIGEIKKVTYQDGTHIDYGYQTETSGISGHYLTSVAENTSANQLSSQTIHYRDANTHKIYQTDYKDGTGILARETFTYCDQADSQCGPVNPTTLQMHGQIKRQQLKNGAYVHYRYDSQGRGLLIDKWEPTWNANLVDTDPKTHYDYYSGGDGPYYYPWIDRIKKVTHPANVTGNVGTETYEYDRAFVSGITDPSGAPVAGRGLVTKITHADLPTDTYQQFKYDWYGNKRWEDNELRKFTNYTYDEYNRVQRIARPLNETTDYTYNPTNGSGSSYKHTTNNPDTVKVWTSASTNVVTSNVYDENFRKISSTAADGSPSAAITFFHYDPVGNQDSVTDPRGTVGRSWPNGDPAYTTYTDYDSRNRRSQMREPLGQTTQFYYDDSFNVTRIIRPDNTTETKVYDGMTRVKSDTVPKSTNPVVNIVTQFEYYPYTGQSSALLKKVIDGEGHAATFEYDAAGLKTKMIYPDSSSQQWAYDNVHNLKNRTAVAGQVQSFTYDKRNRKIGMSWSNGADSATYGYDPVGRLTSATNANSAVTRQYDDAGRLMYDQQNVTGLGSIKTVNYAYDNDGNLKQMSAPVLSGYDFTFLYDDLRRLDKIQLTNSIPLFQYYYDQASNEIERDNLWNGVLQIYPRDELNRIKRVTVPVPMSNWTAREVYDYWPSGRLRTVTHEYNLQDQFDYYLDGELKSASYNVVPTPTPSASPTATPTPSPGQVAEPTCAPRGGNIYPDCCVSVMISTTTVGAQIRYTLDGGAHWATIANGGSTDSFAPGVRGMTLTAIAFKSGMQDSNPHSEDYVFEDPRGSPLQQETVIRSVTYNLDKTGNRTSVVDGAVTMPYTLNPNNLNEYSQVGTYSVTNGSEHEISDYQGYHYDYINDERLSSVNAGHGVSYQLAYDALGRCVKRTLNGAQSSVTTYFIYDGEKPVLEYDGGATHTLVGYNIYGKGIDEILERAVLGTDNQWRGYYFQQDHEGSIRFLTDATGALVEYYRYDVFGAPSIWGPPPTWPQLSASAYGNRFMFTGREFAPFGFYEYRARAYHPTLGRFMSEDPKLFGAGDYNLFRYCHNDPIDFTDPMGLFDVGFEGYGTATLTGGTRNTVGNVALRSFLEERGGVTFSRSQTGQNLALNAIKGALAKNPNEPINIFGYSRGSKAANDLAGKAGMEGIKIKHEVLIDPVSIITKGQSLKIPSNVQRADIYYQTSGGPFHGGPAANPSSSVVNHDLSGPGTNHNTIVEKALRYEAVYHTGSHIPELIPVPEKIRAPVGDWPPNHRQ